MKIDETDRKILAELQRDAGQSLDEIAKKVGSSKTPVWNRIRKLREAGVIGAQTVALDAEALGFEACFFVLIRTSEHEAAWQRTFLKALQERPEVQEAHRLAGDIDYILKVRVKNARAYDAFYQDEAAWTEATQEQLPDVREDFLPQIYQYYTDASFYPKSGTAPLTAEQWASMDEFFRSLGEYNQPADPAMVDFDVINEVSGAQ